MKSDEEGEELISGAAQVARCDLYSVRGNGSEEWGRERWIDAMGAVHTSGGGLERGEEEQGWEVRHAGRTAMARPELLIFPSTRGRHLGSHTAAPSWPLPRGLSAVPPLTPQHGRWCTVCWPASCARAERSTRLHSCTQSGGFHFIKRRNLLVAGLQKLMRRACLLEKPILYPRTSIFPASLWESGVPEILYLLVRAAAEGSPSQGREGTFIPSDHQ